MHCCLMHALVSEGWGRGRCRVSLPVDFVARLMTWAKGVSQVKITSVEAIEIRLPEDEVLDKASSSQNSLILKIHTDEGLTGYGEIDS